ncbi:MAG: cupin domain-containing protein [Gluconacetobacter diazotrophicus]|nr:cupin domain-containing protein [Gluconacetobacter diazotrophicus]
MPRFATLPLSAAPVVPAPDGSDVRPLLSLPAGSLAHFTLPAGAVSLAVQHRTVSELWFVESGEGEMWREQDGAAETVPLRPGVSLSIPLGCRFQFRAGTAAPLRAVAVTMPPWPGPDEAFPVPGPWAATVSPS